MGVAVFDYGTWGICTRRAGKLYKARSRLYRRRFLQVNTRWKALAEIYTMHSFAPLSNLKIFVKNCWNFCCFFLNFRKFCSNFAQILLKFRQILTNFFRDFSNFSKTKHTANVCWAVPQAGRFSETFTGFCTCPVCPFLASSCARPAAALRD